jgi:hypothetical protein
VTPAQRKWPDDRDRGFLNKTAVEAVGGADSYHSEALLLGRGGDDGLWMRFLGSETNDFHRCGALIVARDRIAYQERISDSEMPKGMKVFSCDAEIARRGSASLTVNYLAWMRQ